MEEKEVLIRRIAIVIACWGNYLIWHGKWVGKILNFTSIDIKEWDASITEIDFLVDISQRTIKKLFSQSKRHPCNIRVRSVVTLQSLYPKK